ncbi:hypothetical protein BCR42DRAFT_428779 [Absidia repens]|uniref:C2H2-type domain-containing protein n=1 Tax=Absidia repens TaxID=90262 RepID=A0A1X2HY37_9FUNG|nr:hypothetical protein BCR42DRAFT_428779 [Absidia repens]
MATHPSAEDFCVSDLLDSYSHHQHIASPTLTDTTLTTNTNYPTYFSQLPMHPPQGFSPNTEYWISPTTPLMESMDGYMNTNSVNTVDQQPYFFVKQQNNTSPALLTASPAFIPTAVNSMNHHSTALSVALSYNAKKKMKKVHHCPHCHHTSNRANNMKEHILTHDPYRPKLFTCNVCQKSFARKHDMKRHTKSHLRVPRKQSKSTQQHRHHHQQHHDYQG